MKGYIADDESHRESQGEWSENSQCIQEMILTIFKSNSHRFFQIMHGSNMLSSSSSSAF